MLRSNKSYVFTCFVFILFLVGQAHSQESWEKKSYKQWTLSEVVQILNDSPWAQTQDERVHITYQMPANAFAAVIRLRSALPIRQAIVRQRMIFVNYDKLSTADQARFDSEVKGFLECPDCTKYYIVTLDSPIISGRENSVSFDIVWTLKNLSLDNLKSYVYLVNDKGERRDLVHFIPPKREGAEAMFVFQRFDEQGKPLLSTSNKIFYFKIDEKMFEKRSVPLKRFTFNVSKLIRNNEIVF